jgi:hypothetical protein
MRGDAENGARYRGGRAAARRCHAKDVPMKNSLWLASLTALCASTAWANQPAQPAQAATHKAEAKSAQSVWDWSAIDSNKDHLIEPAEMEKFLADHPGPLKK